MNEKVPLAVTLVQSGKEWQSEDKAMTSISGDEPASPCRTTTNRKRLREGRGSISLDESILTRTAPVIHIIPDNSPEPSVSQVRDRVSDDDVAGSRESAGKCNNGESPLLNPSNLFYTLESSRTQNSGFECRNSLPRVSLTSTRNFAPRSSWNGSKTALLQLQRRSSRLEGVPAQLARKYPISTLVDHSKEQVLKNVIQLSFVEEYIDQGLFDYVSRSIQVECR